MAIRRIRKGFAFTGLSTDTKPTENVPIFTEYMCTDTGDLYLYTYVNDGDGTKEWRLLLT